MATASEGVEIPVEGMTCDHCVGMVQRALEAVPGVGWAVVDLESGRASVHPRAGVALDRGALREAVEAAGYQAPDRSSSEPAAPTSLVTIGTAPPEPEVEPTPASVASEEWDVAIGGMHCASCVGRVESALATVPGVHEARVNLATERASLRVDPSAVREEHLAEAVARAGYSARRAERDPYEGAEGLRRERAAQVAIWRRRLVVGVVLTIPLAILGFGPMFGLFPHAAWVGWTMLALATPLQIYLGAPYYLGAWGRLLQGSTNMDTLIAIGSTTAYGYSLYELLIESPSLAAWAGLAATLGTALVVACGVGAGLASARLAAP